MFAGERSLSLWLRAAHLMAVAWLCAGLMGAPGVAIEHGPGQAVLASGLAMLVLDLWARRIRLSEVAGGVVLLKLALVAVSVWRPGWALPLFWVIVALSALSSHASKAARHRRWWPVAGRAPRG